MLMSEIKKTVVDVPATDGYTTDLAQQAEELLGYTALKTAVASDKATDTKILGRVLRSLDMEVLNVADVKAYQLQELRDLTKKMFDKWMATNEEVETWHRFNGPCWMTHKIEEYKQPIPSFVLNKAVQIKKALPDCEIFIHQLEASPDPFMVVRLTAEKQYDWGKHKETVEEYWVEVWDEPRFESRM
jgi:hypothetical protein